MSAAHVQSASGANCLAEAIRDGAAEQNKKKQEQNRPTVRPSPKCEPSSDSFFSSSLWQSSFFSPSQRLRWLRFRSRYAIGQDTRVAVHITDPHGVRRAVAYVEQGGV